MFETFEGIRPSSVSGTVDQLRDLIFQAQEEKFRWAEDQRAEIRTTEALQEHCKQMREQWIENMGGLVTCDAPLDARTTRTQDLGSFTLESVLFRSCTDSLVSASLYLPKGISYPAPAVLFVCGHSENGRMYPTYQVVCRTLVKAGLIVLAMDPTGQGERSNFYDPVNDRYLKMRAVHDHDACGIPTVATGKFLLRYFLGDQMRAVDYMLTRPEIDPKRIGITGNSGGGTQTAAMMACDPRLAAAAPGTFISNRREIMHTGQPQDAEQIWPGITEIGFDHVTPFMIFAPRPAAIMAVKSDFFPIEGTRETFHDAKRFYGLYGKEENVRIYEDRSTHRYSPWLAVRAAEFFTEVFYGKKVTVTNEELVPLPEEQMYASPTGQIKQDFPWTKTMPEVIRESAAQCRARRTALPDGERLVRAEQWLRAAVTKNRRLWPLNVKQFPLDPLQEDAYVSQMLYWWSQRRLACVGNWIRPEGKAQMADLPVIVAIWDGGTLQISAHADWIRQQCDAGYQVLVLDVPGSGHLEQNILTQNGRGDTEAYLSTLYRLADDLIYMGDSLPAMRCHDVLQTVAMLCAEFGLQKQQITLYCEGNAGVYGVMAGFLEKEVHMRYAEQLLKNVETQIIGQEVFQYDNTLSVLVPGMLEYFDYDELMR